MKKNTYIIVMAVLAALSTSVRLSAQEIITFDAPGAATVSSPACGSACGTVAQANNASGAIVGYYTDANVVPHGFLRTPDGQIVSFDAPGAGLGANLDQGTVATSINERGEIAGQYQDSSNVFHGFVRFRKGSFSTFDVPGAGTGAFQGTIGNGINSVGDIAGYFFDANNVSHGFLRDRNGTITKFDPPGAGTGANQGTLIIGFSGESINSEGDITGLYIDANNVFHGFLRDSKGVFTTFDVPGARRTFALSINSEGDITGIGRDTSNINHGFLRDHDSGTITTFDIPGAGIGARQGTGGEGINSEGDITGIWIDANNVRHGFLRDHGDGTFTKFDPPGTGTIPRSGTFALAINDGGAITGYYLDNNNVNHGFLRSR